MMRQEGLSDEKIFEQKSKEVRAPTMQVSGGKINPKRGDKCISREELEENTEY